tara:strand:+ start:1315 stop:1749 length:435 start_codon:yes stop_codon:yes gene_type:complete
MKLSKDVYEYLANFSDDRTIINMLSVNRKFNDDGFFKRVIERKYPLLVEFEKENWKQLFMRKIYYIDIIEKEHGIPYIPNKGYDPEMFYKIIGRVGNIYTTAIKMAINGGHRSIVKIIAEKGIEDAEIKGYKNIVIYLKKTLKE